MSKVTDDWGKWSNTAAELANRFRLAVDHNQRDDEFATAWDMMEFLQETVAAIRSNGVINGNPKSNATLDEPTEWKETREEFEARYPRPAGTATCKRVLVRCSCDYEAHEHWAWGHWVVGYEDGLLAGFEVLAESQEEQQ